MAGFGEQGMAQSRDFAFHVCTICKARVRMSYFVPIFVGYQLFQLLKYADQMTTSQFAFRVCQITGDEFLLLATVLCHEFGHGNMARYLGGQIDHVLLWVFGGICFSSRARTDDHRKLLRDDLLVVAAGPTTHIFQAPFWGIILWVIYLALSHNQPSYMSAQYYIGYNNAWQAFAASLNPFSGLNTANVSYNIGLWSSLPWYLAGSAIRLNVALFLFNVFFPMYPADGAKLLVTSLMFCFGVAPRRACNVLLGVSVPCALLMIVYAAWAVIYGFSHHMGAGNSMLQGMMGFMGLMSLMESWKIYDLRNRRQLHTHPLFMTARSWQRQDRDAFGVVHRVNVSDLDDDTPPINTGCGTCVSALCPCFRPNQTYVGQGQTAGVVVETSIPFSTSGTALQPAATADLRAQRSALLGHIEEKQSQRQATVDELQKQREGV